MPASTLHYQPHYKDISKKGITARNTIVKSTEAPDGTNIITKEEQQQWIKQILTKLKQIHPGTSCNIDLQTTTTTITQSASLPRYSLAIVDHDPSHKKRIVDMSNTSSSVVSPLSSTVTFNCGILIIPQGREGEYMFSHPVGQQSLCSANSFHRLLLVTLNRSHHFESLTIVQDELRPYMPPLFPPSVAAADIPFLSIQPDVGERHQLEAINSKENGQIVIEDVKVEKQWNRRMVFTQTGIIQSEAKLIKSTSNTNTKTKNNKSKQSPTSSSSSASSIATSKWQIDYGHLPCPYQQAIVSAMAMLPYSPSSMLMIGLGPGSLQMFFSFVFPQLAIKVIEIDQQVLQLSERWFGFRQGSKLSCEIGNGVEYLQQQYQLQQQQQQTPNSVVTCSIYDVIIIDCNSHDLTEGLAFPPVEFLHSSSLTAIHSLLQPQGLFILNFACRQPALKTQLLTEILNTFNSSTNTINSGQLYEMDTDDEDVNVIIIGVKGAMKKNHPSDAETPIITVEELQQRVLTKKQISHFNTQTPQPQLSSSSQLPFNWDDDLDLIDRIHSIRRISRPSDPDSSLLEYLPLPVRETPSDSPTFTNHTPISAVGMPNSNVENRNAAEKKRLKAKAHKAKQKQRKKEKAKHS